MQLEADIFIKNLSQIPFSIFAEVSKKTILNDIKQFLKDDIPGVIKTILFYKVWIKDICFCVNYIVILKIVLWIVLN